MTTAGPQEKPGRAAAARRLAAAVGVTVVYGLILLIFFEPGVQQDSAEELVARADDARAFLIADLLFPFIYGLASGLALLALARQAPHTPLWMRAGGIALLLAGLCDIIENVLLLTATDDVSRGTVDAAHAVALPKLAFFVVGAVAALAALAVAYRGRRAGA